MNMGDALQLRYKAWINKDLVELIIQECEYFITKGLGDKKAPRNLASSDPNIFWQQFSEVIVANQMQKCGLKFAHPSQGPDFLVDHADRRLHVEVVTPEARGLPDFWVNHKFGMAFDFPHKEILLRWTSAIKDKSEKLLGIKDKNIRGYLDKKIVHSGDIYVIAINARLLRGFGGAFSEMNGISQLPFAVEATLGVGSLQVKINRHTLQCDNSKHQYRAVFSNQNGAPVPANTFFDPQFSPISAIWAMDLDEMVLMGRSCPMVLVHNPNADNPLPKNLLPAHSEYTAIETSDSYVVKCEKGRLPNPGEVEAHFGGKSQ